MAALPVKEEGVENSFFAGHQISNQRVTQQQMSNSGSLEASSVSTPSSQNALSSFQGKEHNIQFMSPYGDRQLHSNTQLDTCKLPSIPNGLSSEPERQHSGSNMLSSGTAGVVAVEECQEPLSPSHTENMILSNAEAGSSNSAASKRNHSANKPSANDPLSHRIIEKRRRDRMNNCLADLSRLIPTYYLKKGRGRIEKTEIIEMAIKYMKHLQAHACNQIETCEITTKQETANKEMDHFQMGYQEAMSETLEFLRDSEGFYSGDSLCVRIMNHLTKHCEKIVKNEGYTNFKANGSSTSSSSSGYHANGSSNGSSSDGNGSSSNLGSDGKNVNLTEESAYRSEDPHGSDEREMNFTPTGFEGSDYSMSQGVSDGYHPSLGHGSNASSSGDDNNNRLYKFKSNMKHRFSADAEHSQAKKKRRDSDSFGSPRQSPFTHYTSNHEKKQTSWSHTDTAIPSAHSGYANQGIKSPTVPVFALSSSGEYYIPLSLDQNLIAPFMDHLPERSSTSILHPVSIHVNFSTSLINSHSHLPQIQVTQFPLSQDSMKATLDHFNAYTSRNQKDERRRHANHPTHSHSNTYAKKDYTYPTEIRALRTTGGSLTEMHPDSQEGMTQHVFDNRGLVGRHSMKEFHNKYSNKHLSWPYQIPHPFNN